MSIAGAIYRAQCRYLPSTRFFDRFIAFQGFVYAHRRLPLRRRLLNDVLHCEKTSRDLDDPLFGITTDKEYVKDFVAAKVGRRHAVKTLNVIRGEHELAEFDFPVDCCIKPTHLSGHVVFRRGGAPVDLKRLGSWFRMSHYHVSRERQYKNLRPKIIVEPIIADPGTLRDYKVFCDHGEPTIVQVDLDRHTEHKRRYYTAGFEYLPFTMVYPKSDEILEKPGNWDEMIDVARAVTAPFRFCRADFYLTESVFVGEITHHHESAYGRFIPRTDELRWSSRFFRAGASDTRV